MYRIHSSIKYRPIGVCTNKLNLLSKQQRSFLILRLLGLTELVFSGNHCHLSHAHHNLSSFSISIPQRNSIGQFSYVKSSSSCFSQSGGVIRFNFFFQNRKQCPKDKDDPPIAAQIQN